MSIIFEGLRRESATPPDVDTRGALDVDTRGVDNFRRTAA